MTKMRKKTPMRPKPRSLLLSKLKMLRLLTKMAQMPRPPTLRPKLSQRAMTATTTVMANPSPCLLKTLKTRLKSVMTMVRQRPPKLLRSKLMQKTPPLPKRLTRLKNQPLKTTRQRMRLS